MKTLRALSPSVRRNLISLFAAGLLFWSSLASLLPTLPLYIEHIGGTRHQVGVVMGSFALGLLLSRPWLGPLADQRGRKFVMLIGMAAVAIAPLGYWLTQSIPVLMGIRVFHSLSIAAFAMGYATLVTDLAPDEHRGELIGYMSLVQPIGVAIGPALGGLLQDAVGYMPLFLMSASLGTLGLICLTSVQETTQRTHKTSTVVSDRGFWRLLLSPRLQVPTVIMSLIGLVFGILSTFVPLFIKDSNVGLNPGFFYMAAAIASFIVRFSTGRASDRYGRGLLITISLVCYLTAMVVLSTAQNAGMFLLAGLIEGLGGGIFIPTTVALISDRSQPHERGRVLSLCFGGFDLGMFLAGPGLGFVADWFGFRGLFTLSASCCVLAIAIFVTLSSKDWAHSWRFALGQGEDIYALPKQLSDAQGSH